MSISKHGVLMVGSAEASAGGVTSVIRLIRKMPVWQEYRMGWLGTQIQRNYLWKLLYALKGNIQALFILWRYDIIHFHVVPDKPGLIIQLPIMLLARILGKRVVEHLHVGNQLEEHTQDVFFKGVLRKADRIFVLSPKWKTLLETAYSDIPVPVSVVPNACDEVEALPYDQHEHTLLFAGYLYPNKGVDLILRAFAQVSERFPDWCVHILGTGIVAEEQRLKELAQRLCVAQKVNFAGYVQGEEKKKYFRHAGIYCMCSRFEGFPMVVLEAWRYGVPVVATPVGGLPDVTLEGKNVCTFPFDDADALAQQLNRLMGDETLRKDMAQFSLKFVQEYFSLSRISDILRAEYRALYLEEKN